MGLADLRLAGGFAVGGGDVVAGGGVASACQLDVTDQASVDRFVGQADALYGRVDVLVNAAGRLEEADTARFEDMSPDAAAALLAVDVIGAMRMCRAVIPHMRRHGRGAIINFSSTYGNGINPANAVNWVPVTYCAAKGAIRGMTASLARDVAPEIRVNALAPGPISGNWEQEWGVAHGAVPRIRRCRLHQWPGDPCGRRLGPSRVTLAVTSAHRAASAPGYPAARPARIVGLPFVMNQDVHGRRCSAGEHLRRCMQAPGAELVVLPRDAQARIAPASA